MMYCDCSECCGDQESLAICVNAIMEAEIACHKAKMNIEAWKVLSILLVVLAPSLAYLFVG